MDAAKLPPKLTDTHIFFFGYDVGYPEDCFQQWYPSEFVEPAMDNATFTTAEQYMMYMKAQIFGDAETAQKIKDSSTPAEAKTLGRQVKNFNQAVS